ncbi:MAG: hypothetical protein LKF40_05615 [Megasphaera sp.]|nr:hypothetical protein [Megasphaera sp.]
MDSIITTGRQQAVDDYGLKHKESGMVSSTTTTVRTHDDHHDNHWYIHIDGEGDYQVQNIKDVGDYYADLGYKVVLGQDGLSHYAISSDGVPYYTTYPLTENNDNFVKTNRDKNIGDIVTEESGITAVDTGLKKVANVKGNPVGFSDSYEKAKNDYTKYSGAYGSVAATLDYVPYAVGFAVEAAARKKGGDSVGASITAAAISEYLISAIKKYFPEEKNKGGSR